METRKIDNHISIGGQPSAEEIEELRQQGFRTIINLRTEDENGVLHDEERLAENIGLSYTSIPVAPDLLDDIAIQRFGQAVDSVNSQPAYVHCQGGGRAAMMTLLHLAIEHGWSLKQAYAQGEKRGIGLKPDSPYQEFFEGYIKRHSPAER